MTISKQCRSCGLEKTKADFYASSGRTCKPCVNVKNKVWHENNKARHTELTRDWNLRNTYGITLVDYNKRLEAQSFKCAICGFVHTENNGPKARLHVDHCHSSGVIRGLICHSCNVSLGLMKDDPERLLNAANYLMNHYGQNK